LRELHQFIWQQWSFVEHLLDRLDVDAFRRRTVMHANDETRELSAR